MSIDNWKTLLLRTGVKTENAIDYVQTRFQKRLKPDQRLHVIAYRGFGASHANGWQGHLRGRVLRYREPGTPGASTLWNNLRQNYARFDTDELAGVKVNAQVGDEMSHAVSDEEGYFECSFSSSKEVDETSLAVTLSLPEFTDIDIDGDPVIELPSHNASFGVISDIDDTLLVTQATSLLRMMRLTLLESSDTRVAFPGVAPFYQALHQGHNPFFYVSSSPWNLYEFLTDFMALQNIVPGPLMLRDFGIDSSKFIAGSHKDHKLEQIRSVLNAYPSLPFVLSGDSGQDDPEIYHQISMEYPDQIKAIYIRDVSDQWRDREIQLKIESCKDRGIDMLLVPDTQAAAVHAASLGLIAEDTLADIAAATEQDLLTPATFEDQSV